MKIVRLNRTYPFACIIIPYTPNEEIWVWVRAQHRAKHENPRWHAIAIAERLRVLIDSYLFIAAEGIRGRHSRQNAPYVPEAKTLLNDPAGKENAFLAVPILPCHEGKWDELYRHVHDTARFVAKEGKMSVFTYLSG